VDSRNFSDSDSPAVRLILGFISMNPCSLKGGESGRIVAYPGFRRTISKNSPPYLPLSGQLPTQVPPTPSTMENFLNGHLGVASPSQDLNLTVVGCGP